MPDERDAPAAGLLRLFRAAPFRLTLLSLALFAFAGSAFMAYVYIAATGEAHRRTDAEIRREAESLVEVYNRAGVAALNPVLVSRMAGSADSSTSSSTVTAARSPAPSPKVPQKASQVRRPGSVSSSPAKIPRVGRYRPRPGVFSSGSPVARFCLWVQTPGMTGTLS